MDIRTDISSYERKLHRVTKPIGDVSFLIRRFLTPSRYLTLRSLCDKCNIDTSKLTYKVQIVLERRISQVSQAGSRMTRDCAVVQFDEDSDEVIRYGCAHGAVVAFTRSQIDDLPCIVVPNPEEIYTKICKYYRDRLPVEYTVVAGSIGKTSTKRMISSVYSAYYKTFNDPENENQLPCVGYAVQHLSKRTEVSVQELSEDMPGCLGKMMDVLSPQIAIITVVDKSHIEAFGSERAVYDEVATVIKKMPQDGIVIINMDDAEIVRYTQTIHCKIQTISLDNSNADLFARNIKIEPDGLHFEIIEKQSGRTFPITMKSIYARHNVYSALYAFAAGVNSNIPYEKIIQRLKQYRAVGIRQNVYSDIWNRIIIYADCYNAVAKSVKSAIETASEIPIKGRRIVVLGDVEEAGEFSEQTHIDIIKCVDESNFDVLIAYGPKLSKAIRGYSLKRNFYILQCQTKQEAEKWLKKNTKKGDLVLFKSSRKSALETIIKNVWSITYRLEMLRYYWAIIKWRLKILLN